MAERFRCSVASREAEEPMLGTASRVRRWLAVEQPGPWGRDAVGESRLDAEVGRALLEAGRRHGVRIVLVRRPGWEDSEPRCAFLAHTAAVGSWIEEVDVTDPRELLDLDLAALAAPEPPGVGRPGPATVHLVCTHGRHDSCCADFGRPVVRALAAAGAADVWESSHVGGDRFAANIVCLPHGVYFGRVDPDGAVALLEGYAAGLLDLHHYRGRSCYAPLTQAAEVFARRELDETRLDGLSLVDGPQPDDDRVVARFDAAGRVATVTVRRERHDAPPLTCTSAGPGHPWRYVLESVDVT